MPALRTEHTRLLMILGTVAVGLLLLMVVPAMASANAPAATAPPAAQEESPAADDLAADEPAPADEAPADEAAQEGEAPVPPDPLQPAPPPAATEPEASTPAPAPAGDPQPTPPLSTGTPAAPEAPEESAPESHAQTIVLPAVSGLPAVRGAPPLERTVSAGPPPAAAAPAITPVEPPSAPPDPPTTANAPARTRAHPAHAPPRSNLVETLGGVDRRAPDALPVAPDLGPGPAGASAEDEGANPFATLDAVGGPAPAGSNLLAVLASYVLPGGGLPTSTLLFFVQLAVILAAFYAPRSGIGERIHALGRLGPRLGYRTVLARPG